MGISRAEKNLPSETYHLKPRILIHWETSSYLITLGNL